MAKVEQRATLDVSVPLTLTEAEARALEALTSYGTDVFLKVFYEKMGRAYLEPHEAGLRSLFSGISDHVPSILRRADEARKLFDASLRA